MLSDRLWWWPWNWHVHWSVWSEMWWWKHLWPNIWDVYYSCFNGKWGKMCHTACSSTPPFVWFVLHIPSEHNHTYFVFILTAITTVLTVPRGSWNILIEEVSPSNNTLSMQAKITVYLQNSRGFNWPFFLTLFQSSVATTLMEMHILIWTLISMLGWAGLGGFTTRTPERVNC